MICKNCGKEVSIREPRCPHCDEIIPPVSNGLAIAGFVLAVFPFYLGLLGTIFSALGLKRAKQCDGKNKGLSIAGLILSIMKMSFWALIIALEIILLLLSVV